MSVVIAGINLHQQLQRVNEYWKPLVVGQVNDQLIKVAKFKGAFVWHAHEHEDEMFTVLEGSLRIQLEDGEIALQAGECCVIPRTVRHCPVADGECSVMLIETDTTGHTGAVLTPRTVSLEAQRQP